MLGQAARGLRLGALPAGSTKIGCTLPAPCAAPSLRPALLAALSPPGRQARRSRRAAPAAAAAPVAAAAAATGPAAQGLLAGMVAAWHANPASVLLAAGAFVLGVSLSIFLLAAIPATLAMRRTALAMEQLLHTVREEVPDTASTLRLSGLELADCIEEVSMLSNDLTMGLRSSARAVTAAQQGVQQGVDLAGKAVTGYVVPKLRTSVPEARDALQAALEERAQLDYTAAAITEVARTTKTAAQRLRMGLAALGLARGAAVTVQMVRGVAAGGRRRGGAEEPDGGDGGGSGVGRGTYAGQGGTYRGQGVAAWESS